MVRKSGIEDGTQLTIQDLERAANEIEKKAEHPIKYKEIDLDGDATIALANILIENMPSLTLDEGRLFDTLLAELPSFRGVKEGADPLKIMDSVRFLSINVSDLADIWGIEDKNIYSQAKKALQGLASKTFSFEYIDAEGKAHMFTSSLIASAHYVSGQAKINVELSSSFAPYLLVLKSNFTTMLFSQTVKLSRNARRLYELLAQYRSVRSRTFSVGDFKAKMGIEGRYNGNNWNLRKKILDPSVKDISESTDMIVRYEIRGRGETAVLDFTFVLKEEFTKNKKIPSKVRKADLDLLMDLCKTTLNMDDFSEEEIRKLCEFSLSFFDKKEDPVGDAYTCFTSAVLEFRRRQVSTEIRNPIAYLNTILKSKCEKTSQADGKNMD